MTEDEAWDRVRNARHGILGTVHPKRGVDLVPVVYAVDEDRTIFIPVDTVKQKATTQLQRLRNIEADPRCTLLVEEYDEDWSRLWWVRVHGEGRNAVPKEVRRFVPLLADRYEAYREGGSVVGGIAMFVSNVTGWKSG